ncbi:hypothetical protein FOHLNKBM_6384 [Methylobacterium longum]|nr:hypothetical protein FOHLNKBM_6384 [Methylobacterium longum]
MSALRAPTARRIPISLVRSVTVTVMMFMMLMPPTSSDTPATEVSSSAIVRVAPRWASIAAAGSETLKSSSCPSSMRWRWRSSPSISVRARPIASSETALATM